MTYSIGFRAPSTRDLVTFFGDHVATTATKADAFYRDPDLERQESHGKLVGGWGNAWQGTTEPDWFPFCCWGPVVPVCGWCTAF